jgi:hypothetical protein
MNAQEEAAMEAWVEGLGIDIHELFPVACEQASVVMARFLDHDNPEIAFKEAGSVALAFLVAGVALGREDALDEALVGDRR